MAQRKCNLLCKMATLVLLVAAVLCCTMLLSEKDVYTAWAEADENGFDIQDGVLVKYSGDATEVVVPDGVTEIGRQAFEDCTTLTSVIIPNGVTSIEYASFRGCSGLVDVVIPEGVTEIGSFVFEDCTSLTNVVIPKGVTEIGSYTFTGCTSLTSIEIPKGVSILDDGLFSGCTNLASIVIPDGVTTIENEVFKECTSLTSIVIPEGVTRIGGYCFYKCTNLTSVKLPNSLEKIMGTISDSYNTYEITAYYTFHGCTSLTSIEIPDGVSTLGYGTFYGCTNLTSIELPNSLTTISGQMFLGCESLIEADIPEGVTSIGEAAFSGCTGLTSVEFPNSLTSIGSYAFSGCTGLTSIEFPNSLTSISGFNGCTGLTSVELPDSLTSIGDSAFSGCTSLTSIELPDKLTSIGKYAFYKCENLTAINIPKGVTSIKETAFASCGRLTSIELPDNLTSIEDSLFSGCTNLSNIKLSKSVTSIGNSAFERCTSLMSIDIPEGVTSIGYSAFRGCEKLTSIELPDSLNTIGTRVFRECIRLTNIRIPKMVTVIEEGTFYGCKSLISVEIPEGVTSIGPNAFYDCESLIAIEIPEGVTSIEYNTFFDCKSLTNIEMPERLTSIGQSAFYNCTSLVELELPEGLTSIKEDAFIYCKGLTSIKIPEGVTEIGASAFYECRDLTEVELPDDLTSIEEDTFSYCSNLTGIEIPKGVTSIGDYAFYNCESLIDIELPKEIAAIGAYAFYGIADDVIFYVEKDSYAESYVIEEDYAYEYLSEKGEEEYFDIKDEVLVKYHGNTNVVVVPEGVTKIGDSAFEECLRLTSVTIPEGVTSIGAYAFADCVRLRNIAFPESLNEIGEGAFDACENITEIKIPAGVTVIKEHTFCDCTRLRSIELPESLVSIERYAFSDCTNLANVTIPFGVTTLEGDAFYGCRNLMKIKLPVSVTYFGYGEESGGVFSGLPNSAVFYVVKDSYAEEYVIDEGFNYEYYETVSPLAKGTSILSYWKGKNELEKTNNCVTDERIVLSIEVYGLPKTEGFTVELYDAAGNVLDTMYSSDFLFELNAETEKYDANCQRTLSFSQPGKKQLIIKYTASNGEVCFKGTPLLYVHRPDIATEEQLAQLASYAGTNMNDFLLGNTRITKQDNGLVVDGIIYNEYSYRSDVGEVYFFVKAVQKGNEQTTLVTDYTILQKLLLVRNYRKSMIMQKEQLETERDRFTDILLGVGSLKLGEYTSGIMGAVGTGAMSGGAAFGSALKEMGISKVTDPVQYYTLAVSAKIYEYRCVFQQLVDDVEKEQRGSRSALSDYDKVVKYVVKMNSINDTYDVTWETLQSVADIPNSGNVFVDWLQLFTSYFGEALNTMTFGIGGQLTTTVKGFIVSPESVNDLLSCAVNTYSVVNWEEDNPAEGLDTTEKLSDIVVKIGSNLEGGDILKNIEFAGMDMLKWSGIAKKTYSFLNWAIQISMTESEMVEYHQTTDSELVRTIEDYKTIIDAAKNYEPLKGTCLSEIPEMIQLDKSYELLFEFEGDLDKIVYNQPGMQITEKIEQKNGKTYVRLNFVCDSLVARNLEFEFYNDKNSCYEWSKWIYSYISSEEEAEQVTIKVQTLYTGTKHADVRKPWILKTAKPGYYEVIQGGGGSDVLYPSVKGGDTCYIYNLDNWTEGTDTIYDYVGNDIFYIISDDADFNKINIGHSDGDMVICYGGFVIARFVNKTTNESNSSTLTVKLARSVEVSFFIEGECGFEEVAGVSLKLPKIIYSAHCPIDMYVFDPDGNVVQILPDGQESAVYTDYGVFVVEYNAEKDEYLKHAYLYDDAYTVKFVGIDEGTMEYSVVRVSEDGSADIYEQKDIPISKEVVLSIDPEEFTELTDNFGNVTTVEKVEEMDEIQITTEVFPDAVFREFIATNLDTDGNSSLSFEEADAVTELDVSGLAISSLKGIECFTELENLNLSGCMVTSLDLSLNTKLVTLDVSGNRLTYLDLYNNPLLTTLESAGNKVTIHTNDTFALSGLTGLDASNVIAWNGASYDAATDGLTNITGDTITYTYDCGNGLTAEFTLVVQRDPIEVFVTRMYRIILEREPDAGSATWINGLKSGEFTGVRVADGFVLSEEMLNKNVSNEEFVKILYRAFFGREADADGLATWKGLLDAGCKKTYVFAGFANSTEFGNLCAEAGIVQGRAAEYLADRQTGLSEADYKVWCFVERMYMEVLNRTADEPGVRSWVEVLLDGSYTGTQVADGFIMSEEFLAKNMTDEEYVRIMYRAFFGRDADPEGLATWTNALATGWTKQEVFAGFANSGEFGVLCEQAGIVKGTAEGK